MADNLVLIKIDVKADTKQIDKVKAKLIALRGEAEALSDEMDDLGDSSNDVDASLGNVGKTSDSTGKSFNNLGRNTNKLEDRFTKLDKVAQGFGKFLRGFLKVGLKLIAINFAAVAASLLSVNAAFAVGRFAIQAWHASLTVASAGAASFIAVLAGLAAGQREWNAALQAYNYKYSPGLKAGTQEATAQLRGISQNTRLAVLGAEALNGAFATLSRNAQVDGTMQKALEALGDFAAAAADPSKAFVGAGNFLGLLKKNGKITDEVTAAAEEIGPQFVAALQKAIDAGNTSSTGIIGALLSGDMSGSVSGQLDALNNTLFGTVKRNFQLIKEQFADLGQGFLPGFTQTVEEMSGVVRRFVMQISGAVQWFTKDSLNSGLVGAFEKVADWSAKVINEYLPRTEGMITTIKGWGDSFSEGWSTMVEALRPLLDGAKVLMNAFGPAFKALFTEFAGGVQDFSRMLQENEEGVTRFGDGVLKFFQAFSDFSGAVKEAFITSLPILTGVLSVLTDIVSTVAELMKGLSSLGSAGGLASLLGLMAGYWGLGQLGRRGGVVGQGSGKRRGLLGGVLGGAGGSGAYTINASTVYVNGGVVQGGAGVAGIAGATGKTGRLAAIGNRIAPIAGPALTAGGAYGVSKSTNLVSGGASGAAAGAGIALMTGQPWAIPIAALAGGIYGEFFGGPKSEKAVAKESADKTIAARNEETLNALKEGDFKRAEALVKLNRGQELKTMFSGIQDTIANWYPAEGQSTLDAPTWSGELLKLRQAGKLTEQEMIDWEKSAGKSFDELAKKEEEWRKQAEPVVTKSITNFENLMKATGMSNDAVAELASTLGVDLTENIKSSQAFLEEAFNISIPQSIEDMMATSQDAFINAIDSATNPIIKKEETAQAVDLATSQIFEQFSSGMMTQADAAKYVQSVFDYEYAKTYNPMTGEYDPLAAYQSAQSMVGKGGMMYGSGALLEGKGDLANSVQPIFDQIFRDYKMKVIPGLLGSLDQGSLDKFGIAQNSQMTPEMIEALTPAQVGEIQAAATDMMNVPSSISTAMVGGAQLAGSTLANSIHSAINSSVVSVRVSVSGQIAGATTTVTQSSGGGDGGATGGKPNVNLGGGAGLGDTASSRLNGVLSRHSGINSSLAGRRTITSGVRGNNLGSLGSDHLTGNAYDIVGDNLGAYKTAVEAQGGFAELHGRGGDRHLHVAQGDTGVPMSGLSNSGGGGNSYVFQINSTPNATPQQIINEAMRQMDRREREKKERS